MDIEEEEKEIPETDVTVTEKSEVLPLDNVEVSDHFEADTNSATLDGLNAIQIITKTLQSTRTKIHLAGHSTGGLARWCLVLLATLLLVSALLQLGL